MGRRSTNSTKAGKFMNPTDQASMLNFRFFQKKVEYYFYLY